MAVILAIESHDPGTVTSRSGGTVPRRLKPQRLAQHGIDPGLSSRPWPGAGQGTCAPLVLCGSHHAPKGFAGGAWQSCHDDTSRSPRLGHTAASTSRSLRPRAESPTSVPGH
jgi:hypothetical protein